MSKLKEEMQSKIRNLRDSYDNLDRADKAILNRCENKNELWKCRVYYKLTNDSNIKNPIYLTYLILAFPSAKNRVEESFSFGRYLKSKLKNSDLSNQKMQRLVDSEDREELNTNINRLLNSLNEPVVDWGVLGLDILWFIGEIQTVKHKWLEDYYTNNKKVK